MPVLVHILRRTCMGAAAFLFCAALAAQAPEPVKLTVRSTGYAEGVGYAAREQAIQDARQRALVEVMQALAATEDLKLFRPILREAQAYVPTYDLLRHDQVGKDTRVEIDAHVMEGPLHRDIAAIMLPRLPEKPRVLLVLGEQIADDPIMAVPDFGVAELALKAALEEKGLEVRGVDSLNQLYTHQQLMALVQGGVEDGAKFARENQVHVAVVGFAKTTHGQAVEEVNMQRNTAQLQLKVYRGSDGKLIEEVTAEAIVHSADPFEGGEAAVQDACRKAQNQVITAAAITVLSTRASTALLLTVMNPKTPARLDALAGVLGGLYGAGKPETLYFSEGLARITMPFEGDLAELVDVVAMTPTAGAKVEVTRVLKRDVEIVFLD